ncbi:MAG: hypothetical protein ACLQVL_21540 [Terriglobia bacterium]
MASRTQIVCLHEGLRGRSIDPVFIRTLLKELDPAWIRPWKGSNIIRLVDRGGRSNLIAKMPDELQTCIAMGADTTLMVWADLDDDMDDGDQLRQKFYEKAKQNGIADDDFDRVVFVFAKDRLENWIEFLLTGSTDEAQEGPRVKDGKRVAAAAKKLAQTCIRQPEGIQLPPSLSWSCRNWRRLVERMKA